MYDRAEITVFFGFELRLVYHEEADDTNAHDHDTDDGENAGPACGEIQIESHEAAEYGKNRNEGHHRVDTLGGASVGGVRAVCQPSVESGIVCAGAEKGHHAVEYDDAGNTDGRRGGGKREHRLDQVFSEENKSENGDTPKNITETDEKFSLADLIGKRADEYGGQSGGNCAGANHQRNIRSGGVEHFINKNVQIHIFYNPRHLSDQTEQRKRKPETR